MIERLRKASRDLFLNPVSLGLGVINLLFVAYIYWERRDIAGRRFHYQNESVMFGLYAYLEWPAMWLTDVIGFPLKYFDTETQSPWGPEIVRPEWAAVSLSLLFHAFLILQWVVVGFVFWKIWQNSRSSADSVSKVK